MLLSKTYGIQPWITMDQDFTKLNCHFYIFGLKPLIWESNVFPRCFIETNLAFEKLPFKNHCDFNFQVLLVKRSNFLYSARKSFHSYFTSIVATFKNCVDHAWVSYYTQKILKNFAVAYDQEINYTEHKKILTILMMWFYFTANIVPGSYVVLQSGTKYFTKSKEISQNWTIPENLDICFSVKVDQ